MNRQHPPLRVSMSPEDYIRRIKSLDLGLQQRPLFAEPDEAMGQDALSTQMARAWQQAHPLTLQRLIDYFASLPFLWSDWDTILQVARMVARGQVRIARAGAPLLIKDALAQLCRPTAWHGLTLIPPKKLLKTELDVAATIAAHLCGCTCDKNATALSRCLRAELRRWKLEATHMQRKTRAGIYPGLDALNQCLTQLRRLLSFTDAADFLRAVIKSENQLDAVSTTLKQQVAFFHQGQGQAAWDALCGCLAAWQNYHGQLAGDPRVAQALSELQRIHNESRPFDRLAEVAELVATVQPAYDRLLAAYKQKATALIEDRLNRLRTGLDSARAEASRRNKILLPFQRLKQKISRQTRIPEVVRLQEIAEDTFELVEDVFMTYSG